MPSDPNGKIREDDGRTNYHLNRGDITLNWDLDEFRGVFASGNGGKIKFDDITDGLIATVLFGEVAIGTSRTVKKFRGGQVVIDEAFNSYGSCLENFYFRQSTCAAALGTNGLVGKNYSFVTAVDQLNGQRWYDAKNPYTLFYTILPPNFSTCAKTNEACVVSTAFQLPCRRRG